MDTVLVVDDEDMIREAVASFFAAKGFTVRTAATGQEALDTFSASPCDAVILDLMLPDVSGDSVCRRIRAASAVPIIMLTARTQEEDVLHGLGLGADDYVRKPFSVRELFARTQAVLRRAAPRGTSPQEADPGIMRSGELEINFPLRQLRRVGQEIALTPVEWKLLEALSRHPERAFTREELLDAAFAEDAGGYDRVIDTHVKNLRHKIEADSRKPEYIITVRGTGYRFGSRGQ